MPDNKRTPEDDSNRERATPTEPTGSPFPDPRVPKPEQNVEVVPGQPFPSTDRTDDGGVRAVPKQRTTENTENND